MKHGTLFVKWLPIWFQNQSTILDIGEGEQYKISKQLNFVECSFWPNFTASASRVISGPFVQCNVNVNFGQSVAWNVGHWPIRGRQSTDIEKWSLLSDAFQWKSFAGGLLLLDTKQTTKQIMEADQAEAIFWDIFSYWLRQELKKCKCIFVCLMKTCLSSQSSSFCLRSVSCLRSVPGLLQVSISSF